MIKLDTAQLLASNNAQARGAKIGVTMKNPFLEAMPANPPKPAEADEKR